jgi:hypothetical protein
MSRQGYKETERIKSLMAKMDVNPLTPTMQKTITITQQGRKCSLWHGSDVILTSGRVAVKRAAEKLHEATGDALYNVKASGTKVLIHAAKPVTTKQIGWSYPTSPNATKFKFPKGCYTVALASGANPPNHIKGFTTLQEASAYAETMPQPYSRFSLSPSIPSNGTHPLHNNGMERGE